MNTHKVADSAAPQDAAPIDRRLLLAMAILILIQAIPWSWKTSGVLQMSTNWQHTPWGYGYVLVDTPFGNWPIHKENIHFIRHQALFLGNEDVHLGRGFVSQRVLYAFITKGAKSKAKSAGKTEKGCQ